MSFEKQIKFIPSFNKLHPDPRKNYGIGGMRMIFILKGELGAVQWMMGTNWYIESARKHLSQFPVRDRAEKPEGWDLGYHSYKPMYDGQEPMDSECDVLGCTCYYDGSSLAADNLIEGFLGEGDNYVWEELEKYYNERFSEAKAA